MRKFKKVTAVALSLAMTMAVGMTAMAAGSPDSGDVPSVPTTPEDPTTPEEPKIETIKNATATVIGEDGKEQVIDIKVEELKEDSDAMKILQDQDELKKKVEEAKISVGEGKEVKNVKVLVVGELTAENLPNGKVSVTIEVPGEEDGPVVVLHQKDDGTWEVIEAELKDGQVTAELDGLSPVAVARLEVGEQQTNPDEIPGIAPAPEKKPDETTSGNTATTENSNAKDTANSAANSGSRTVTRRVSPKTGA